MACEACKTIPPVVVEGYEEKGSWGTVGGVRTCMLSFLSPLITLLPFSSFHSTSSRSLKVRVEGGDEVFNLEIHPHLYVFRSDAVVEEGLMKNRCDGQQASKKSAHNRLRHLRSRIANPSGCRFAV